MSLGFTVAGFGVENGGTAVSSSYEPETLAHISRMSGSYDEDLYSDINDLVVALKTAGIYTKIDQICFHQSVYADFMLNLKGVNDPTDVNTTPWDINTGLQFRQANGDYINTGITIGGSGFLAKAKENHISVYIRTTDQEVTEQQNFMSGPADGVGGNLNQLYLNAGSQDSAAANLITNGDFPSNISGWTTRVTGSGSISWNAGQMRFNPTSTSAATMEAYQAISVTPGERYIVKQDVSKFDNQANFFYMIGTTPYDNDIMGNSTGLGSTSVVIEVPDGVSTIYVGYKFIADSTYGPADLDNVVTRLGYDSVVGSQQASATTPAADFDGGGLIGFSRSDTAGTITAHMGTNSASSSVPADTEHAYSGPSEIMAWLFFGSRNHGSSDVLAWTIGESLDATEWAALRTALDTYMTARGVH